MEVATQEKETETQAEGQVRPCVTCIYWRGGDRCRLDEGTACSQIALCNQYRCMIGVRVCPVCGTAVDVEVEDAL